MQTRRLRTKSGGLDLSLLGFGGAPLGNLYAPISDETAQKTLAAAWDAGIRVFDTAPFYGFGLSEERFARALAEKPRNDYVLSTKIGRVLEDCRPEDVPESHFFDTPNRTFRYDYSYDGVMRSHEDSLRRLKLDRIDILLVHDLDISTHGTVDATEARIRELFDQGGYRALDELRSSGAVSAIGGGLNEWQACERLLELGDFDCFLLAGRYTLLEQEALNSFLPLCERRNVGIILGGPFNSGILATGPIAGARYNYTPAPPDILARATRLEADVPGAWRAADRGCTALRPCASGDHHRHPRGECPRTGEGEPRAAPRPYPAGALVRPQDRAPAEGGCACPGTPFHLGDSWHAARHRSASDA